MTQVLACMRFLGPGGIEEEATLELEVEIPEAFSKALLEGRVKEFSINPEYTAGVKYVLHRVLMRDNIPLIELKPAAN